MSRWTLHGRRAVSEVIGALFMIVIAVTAGVMVYVYASGVLGSLQGSKVQQPYLEQVTLDYYAWNDGTDLKLTLRNTGSVPVQFADYFIKGMSIRPTSGSCGYSGNDAILAVEQTCAETLPAPYGQGQSYTQGILYYVRIVTNDGAIFDFSCIPGTAS